MALCGTSGHACASVPLCPCDANPRPAALCERRTPQVVFIGDHGHGVSSVIQSLLGLRFMPGTGSRRSGSRVVAETLVLTQPLEISIRPTAEGVSYPYVRFPDDGGSTRLVDFAEIAERLESCYVPFPTHDEDGNRLAHGVPLRLTIHSPSLPPMDIVQLPGLCQVCTPDVAADSALPDTMV